MSGQWYYQLLMEEFGPVNADELIEMFDAGTLGDDDQVREDSGDWTRLSDAMADLQSATTSEDDSADVISDLSELAFEFEDSGPTKARDVAGPQQVQSTTPEINFPAPAIAATARSASADSSGVPPEAPVVAESETWYYMSFGHMMGPMSFEALQNLARTGVITAEDPVRCGTEGGWRRARNLPGLAIYMAIAQASDVPPGQTVGSEGGPEIASNVAARKVSDGAAAAATDSLETSEEIQSRGEAKGKLPRRKSDKKRVRTQDELPDDVFDDIFSSPTVPKSPIQKTTASVAAAVDTVPPESSGSTTTGVSSVSADKSASDSTLSRPTSSPISQPFPASSPMAAPRPMLVPAPMKQKSGGQGFSIEPKTLGIIGGVIGVMVLAGAIWQFGLPFVGSGDSFKPAFVKDNLKKVLLQLDVAMASKKEAAWTQATTEANVVVGIVLAHAQSCGENSASVTAAISAVGNVQKILAMKIQEKAEIEKAKAEVQGLISKIN